jgi:hypothetical protein
MGHSERSEAISLTLVMASASEAISREHEGDGFGRYVPSP